MNIYRVRYQTSEIFYIQAKTFTLAVEWATRNGGVVEPSLVEFVGLVRNS